MPNLGAKISSHNQKLLSQDKEEGGGLVAGMKGDCNCQISLKADCPIPGACNTNGVVYQATVKSTGGGTETYIGLAKNFKKRFGGHKSFLRWMENSGKWTR